MTLTDVVVGLAVLVGLVGIVVPILPGTLLILVAVVAWAFEVQTTTGWIVTAVAVTCLLVGGVVKYTLPGRSLKAAVPTSTLIAGGIGAVVGFFVIPVVGAFVGFPLGVYAAEHHRVGAALARPSTRAVLKAIGVSILIEFGAGVLAAGVWVVGVVLA